MFFYGNDSPMASSINFMMYVYLYDVYFMLYVCLYDVCFMRSLCITVIIGRKISEIPYDIHKYTMRMFFTEYIYNLNKCCTS